MVHAVRVLPAAGLLQLAAAGLYPGITTDNHTCVLRMGYSISLMMMAVDADLSCRGASTLVLQGGQP
jgi:hypothetical protein